MKFLLYEAGSWINRWINRKRETELRQRGIEADQEAKRLDTDVELKRVAVQQLKEENARSRLELQRERLTWRQEAPAVKRRRPMSEEGTTAPPPAATNTWYGRQSLSATLWRGRPDREERTWNEVFADVAQRSPDLLGPIPYRVRLLPGDVRVVYVPADTPDLEAIVRRYWQPPPESPPPIDVDVGTCADGAHLLDFLLGGVPPERRAAARERLRTEVVDHAALAPWLGLIFEKRVRPGRHTWDLTTAVPEHPWFVRLRRWLADEGAAPPPPYPQPGDVADEGPDPEWGALDAPSVVEAVLAPVAGLLGAWQREILQRVVLDAHGVLGAVHPERRAVRDRLTPDGATPWLSARELAPLLGWPRAAVTASAELLGWLAEGARAGGERTTDWWCERHFRLDAASVRALRQACAVLLALPTSVDRTALLFGLRRRRIWAPTHPSRTRLQNLLSLCHTHGGLGNEGGGGAGHPWL